MVFAVFALLTNYCFIDGCRSKETSLKINIEGHLKKSKSVEPHTSFESTNSETVHAAAQQVPVIYPYPYPVPGVYYPTANTGNIEFERVPDIFQSQNTQFVETISPPQSAPAVIPVPIPVGGVHTEPYSPYQPTNVSPTQEQNIQPVLVNPIATPEPDRRQDFGTTTVSIGGSAGAHSFSDSQYYQPGFGRPPQQPPPQYNACQNKQCRPGSKCVLRRNPNCPRCSLIPVCVDPCETVRCASGYICKAEVGHCGTPYCEPRAICKDPCQGISCPGNDNCTLISLPCTTSCDPVPICGRDPCETTTCPLGQGCYLQEHFCSRPPCRVEAVCRDPCKGIVCGPNEFCYTEDVTCIKAPCNPIPYCKNPCESLSCPVGQHCELEQAFCIRTPCNPIATCKRN